MFIKNSNLKIILNKGEKIIIVQASKRSKKHKRKIKVGITRDLDRVGDKERSYVSSSTTDYGESVKNVNDYVAKLHEDDEGKKVLESVQDYTMHDYIDINNYMKNPDLFNNSEKYIPGALENSVSNIKKFISDAPKFEGKVYRGLQYRTNDPESKQRWETFVKNVESSKEMKFGSFISTSESKMVGVNFATTQHYGSNMKSCLITIKTKSGGSIEKLSQVESEYEVLLDNNKTYKIIKFEKQNEKNHFLELEEI